MTSPAAPGVKAAYWVDAGDKAHLRWVRPELVAQVSFAEWTDGGGIRAPSFLGLRDDKDPRDVVRE